MYSTVSFWFSWLWESLWTLPEFFGNNWMGIALTCVFLAIYQKRALFSQEEFKVAVTWPEKLSAAQAFLLSHWERTIRLWFVVLSVFWIGHALDLVRRNSDSLSSQNYSLSKKIDSISSTCTADKNQLRVADAADKSRADTLSAQNRDQQNTINNCQTQALNLLTPKPFKQTVLTMLTNEPAPLPPLDRAEIMLLSNKSIEPVNMRITCNHDIRKLMFHILGKSNMTMGRQVRVAANTIDLNIQSPPWDMETALWIRIDHEGPNSEFGCTYTRQ